MLDYKKIWDHLNKLPMSTIVVAASRPGSDFIHSLFDGHPEVLTFDGYLLFDEFYDSSISLWGTKIVDMQVRERLQFNNPKDVFYEFAYKHIYKFNSKYDNYEKKDTLGKYQNAFNYIDIDNFVEHATKLIGINNFNRRNTLIAIYGAFSLAKGENLLKKKVILHNIHHARDLNKLIENFKSVKVICAIRDPRSFFSNMESLVQYAPKNANPIIHFDLLNRVLNGFYDINNNKCDIKVNLLERLHSYPKEVVNNICAWLGINFDPILLKSTSGGLLWYGDDMSSVSIESTFDSEYYNRSKERWRKIIRFPDGLVMETIMIKEINRYNYYRKYNNIFCFIFTPLLILLPNKYELDFIIKGLINLKIRLLLESLYFLFKRYKIMYKKYFNTIFRKDILVDHF